MSRYRVKRTNSRKPRSHSMKLRQSNATDSANDPDIFFRVTRSKKYPLTKEKTDNVAEVIMLSDDDDPVVNASSSSNLTKPDRESDLFVLNQDNACKVDKVSKKIFFTDYYVYDITMYMN